MEWLDLVREAAARDPGELEEMAVLTAGGRFHHPAVLEEIRHAEWSELRRSGYTLVIGDVCYVLRWVEGSGTCLCPVKVVA